MARPLTLVDLVIALALVAAVVVLFAHGHHRKADAILADPVRTPGVLNPDVTQANIRSTICRHGWTATIRPPTSYTNALKRKQMRQYAETGSMSDYQEDHLISLEVGGNPTDPPTSGRSRIRAPRRWTRSRTSSTPRSATET